MWQADCGIPYHAAVPAPAVQPKPTWLKVRAPGGENYARLKGLFRSHGLHTVCEEARCPNVGECWAEGTATIMLMGDVCTRGCRFCAVTTGIPRTPPDSDEPLKVAESVGAMGLEYVVLTSVDRDDLPDGGAEHFASTVRAIRDRFPEILVEVLVPDFAGDLDAVRRVVDAAPHVFAHNIETVERLTRTVRDARCGYPQSLAILAEAKRLAPERFTKSSIMLGLGERIDEVLDAMDRLREVDVDVLTLGQYLRPTPRHHRVERFVPPEEFDRLREEGERRGFRFVAAGPLVRSSYRAGEFFIRNIVMKGEG